MPFLRSRSLFLFGVFLGLPLARGAEPAPSLPLEALIHDVVAGNPEVNFYQAEIDAAKAGRRTAGWLANPELSVEAGRKRAREISGTLAGEGTAWSVSLAQTFEWPGRLALRKSIANRQVELAELGLERFRSALANRAQLLAYALQAAAEKSAAAREVADRYQALRELFVARDPSGVTPLLETRVIEAQELALKRRATAAELATRAALAELNQLCGAPLDAPFAVTGADVAFGPARPTADLIAAARERNFEFRMKRVELEQQGLEVSLARHERWPTITVSPFFSEEKAADRERILGVSVTVPLPLSGRARSSADIAEARRRQAEAAVQLAARELEREVTLAAQTYAVKSAEIASWSPDSARKFREAAALADQHYRLGAVPLQTYVELQTAYLDAVEALVDTQREALDAALRLEQLTGVKLELAKP